MRSSRIFRPLPSGKGFRVSRRLIGALVVVAALSAVPANAAPVSVKFGVSVKAYAPTGTACTVSVPAGSNGEVVFAAAKARGCIASYEIVKHPSFGAYVRCINEVCADERTGFFLTYWHFFENGRTANHGISSFSASSGDEIVFAYNTWLGCLISTEEPVC